MSPYLWTQ